MAYGRDRTQGPHGLRRSTASRNASLRGDDGTSGTTRRDAMLLFAMAVLAGPGTAEAAGADSQLTWAVHVSLAPTWFDPAETPGIITPFMVLYALHDAMVKPMPGKPLAPCLAESWTLAPRRAELRVRPCARAPSSTTASR